jgi:hypothetical protein
VTLQSGLGTVVPSAHVSPCDMATACKRRRC